MPRKASVSNTPVVDNFPQRPLIHKVNDVLSALFYIVWLAIGVFFLLVIWGQIKAGALGSLGGRPPTQQTPQSQTPTETVLPGVGRVNINCVQQSLTQEAIQKLVVAGDASTLTAEEKSKLDPCIAEKENPSPSPSS
ncbi:hypothetical protein HYZ70_01670 [Candidatus Curtissbacteria bacterium]|nr:hypothetical protein [Candidatus Curtissbacteria bacterium]